MDRLEMGKIANDFISDLKEKTHDYQNAHAIIMTALEVLKARRMTEPGWFPEEPTSSDPG